MAAGAGSERSGVRRLSATGAPPEGWLARLPVARPVLTTIDSHTCGQMTRVIVDGVPDVDGATAAARRDAVARDHDWLRTVAVLEPRGQRAMFGAALVPTEHPECVTGVVFMDAGGYPDMCGHATIGVATTLVQANLVGGIPPGTLEGGWRFGVETPAGPIPVDVARDAHGVTAVTFTNQPAYLLAHVEVTTPGGAASPVAVAYGGQWYAFAQARDFGLAVRPDRLDALLHHAADVRRQVAARPLPAHPVTGEPVEVGNVVWCDEPSSDRADARNIAIAPSGAYDRSPCGTATSARMAVLCAEGSLEVGQPFVNESILGTTYTGTVAGTADVGGLPGVVPRVRGRAWITGVSRWVAESADPLADGFLL